jgi:hypothetical protein
MTFTKVLVALFLRNGLRSSKASQLPLHRKLPPPIQLFACQWGPGAVEKAINSRLCAWGE